MHKRLTLFLFSLILGAPALALSPEVAATVAQASADQPFDEWLNEWLHESLNEWLNEWLLQPLGMAAIPISMCRRTSDRASPSPMAWPTLPSPNST